MRYELSGEDEAYEGESQRGQAAPACTQDVELPPTHVPQIIMIKTQTIQVIFIYLVLDSTVIHSFYLYHQRAIQKFGNKGIVKQY